VAPSPTSSPSLIAPTIISTPSSIPNLTLSTAPNPSPVPPSPALAPTATETPPQIVSGLTFLEVSPVTQTFPAGCSVSFALRTDPTAELAPYRYWVEGLPNEITACFLGAPAPYQDTLVLNASGTIAPGLYIVHPFAKRGDTPPVSAPITLNLTSCTEFQTGVFTQSVQSNLIPVITSGKPSYQHGLLVPLQVCASDQVRRLKVALQAVLSEAGTPMTTPPPFYIFRSLVWPAPDHIQTHNYYAVNAAKAGDSSDWDLELEVTRGLWLLVFERDRYNSSTDPQDIPAIMTYRLEILY
jgi:hypothetical protein